MKLGRPSLLISLWALICCSCNAQIQKNSPERHESNYFIETPDNTTVFINHTAMEELFGDFSCATRLGYRPLWVINGLSVDLIRETPAYGDTYTELHQLQVEGNFLSFLSIPATPATNNSIVACTAVDNGTVLAHSTTVRMTVLQESARLEVTTTISPSGSESSPHTLATELTTNASNPLEASDVKLIICVSVVCGSLLCIGVATLISVLLFVRMKRQQNLKTISSMHKGKSDAIQSNIYWTVGGVKKQNNMYYWDPKRCENSPAQESS